MSDTERRFQDPMVIELAGEIDYVKAEALGEALCQAIASTHRDTTVDQTAARLIDSLTMAHWALERYGSERLACKVGIVRQMHADLQALEHHRIRSDDVARPASDLCLPDGSTAAP